MVCHLPPSSDRPKSEQMLGPYNLWDIRKKTNGIGKVSKVSGPKVYPNFFTEAHLSDGNTVLTNPPDDDKNL